MFLNPQDLLPRIEELKKAGKVIVFGNGCFELLHVGHIRYLTAAKELGDVLIVAVNTDASMMINKPDRARVIPDHERFEVLAALEAIDFIVPLAEKTPISLIQLFKPDFQAKGTDYDPETMPEKPHVEAYGGKIAIVGDPKDHSTSSILEAVKS
ncbi:MAG: adenylyltransferase/cytidyltransferase family protein [Pyrinomonadaceae bacterium]|nr:adenylyltransferase/cytidyltransferase family protein [Pyrinomonadaceae bacterium]